MRRRGARCPTTPRPGSSSPGGSRTSSPRTARSSGSPGTRTWTSGGGSTPDSTRAWPTGIPTKGGLSCPYRTFARDHAFLPIKSAEGALQYGLQYEAQNRLRGLHTRFAFYLQNSTFYSGAEGNRTPDLRLAKSDPKHRSCSLTFKIACKTALLPLEVFVSVRCCSRGLVYYWCRRTSGSSLL